MSNGEKIARFLQLMVPGWFISSSIHDLIDFFLKSHSTSTGYHIAAGALMSAILFGIWGYNAAITHLDEQYPYEYTGRFNRWVIRNTRKIDWYSFGIGIALIILKAVLTW